MNPDYNKDTAVERTTEAERETDAATEAAATGEAPHEPQQGRDAGAQQPCEPQQGRGTLPQAASTEPTLSERQSARTMSAPLRRGASEPRPPRTDAASQNRRDLALSLIRFGSAALLIGASLLFVCLAAAHPAWVADTYVHFSRAFQHAIGSAFGLLPFSVLEFAIYALILAVPAAIAAYIVLAVKRGGALRRLASWLSRTSVVASILLAVFLTTWSAGYYSAGLGYALGLEVTERSSGTLAAALSEITLELNAAVRDLPRDDSGEIVFPDFDEMSGIAADAWLALAESEAYFSDVSPTDVKPVAASVGMSRLGITGIFMPLTGEANVNTDFPDSGRIFTMAHELAHSFGVAPENEANFAAYLACRASDDPYARYSGYLSAFVYCYNALVGVDQDAAFACWYAMPDEAETHIRERNAYWQSFESPVKEVGSAVNDAYLKTMSQPDGVKSYGRVVDLILADFVDRHSEN